MSAPATATVPSRHDLAVAFGKLDAHDQGCRLRVMEWLDAGQLIVLAAERFASVLGLGVIAWPPDEEHRRWVGLHVSIDMALPEEPTHAQARH